MNRIFAAVINILLVWVSSSCYYSNVVSYPIYGYDTTDTVTHNCKMLSKMSLSALDPIASVDL